MKQDNQKKKSPLGIILILLLVLILVLGGVLVILLVQKGVISLGRRGASSGVDLEQLQEEGEVLLQEEIRELPMEEGAEAAVKSFLTLYRDGEEEAAEYLIGVDSLEFPEIQATIASGLTYTIEDVRVVEEEDGTHYALVDVTIETVSFKDAYEAVREEVSEDADPDEILSLMAEKLKANLTTDREIFNVEVVVFDYLDSKQILMTSELSDAITGGLMSYLEERQEEMVDE